MGIRPESAGVLRQLESWLRNNPKAVVTFDGHTDSDGEDSYNIDLSNRRAQAVVDWLAQQGLVTDRFIAPGFGEQRPVAYKGTSHGKSLNRRVEVRVDG